MEDEERQSSGKSLLISADIIWFPLGVMVGKYRDEAQGMFKADPFLWLVVNSLPAFLHRFSIPHIQFPTWRSPTTSPLASDSLNKAPFTGVPTLIHVSFSGKAFLG